MGCRQSDVHNLGEDSKGNQDGEESLAHDPSPWDVVPEGVEVVARWYSVVVTADGRRIPVAKIPND